MGKRGWKKGKPRKYYTVYLRKTDEIVAFGTSEECTKELGFANAGSFRSVVSKAKKGLSKKYDFIVEETPYDEEMEEAYG